MTVKLFSRQFLFPAVVCAFLGVFFANAPAESPATGKAVNAAAAVRSLERATDFLGSSDWQQAAFEARVGASYDPSLADFPYIEALALAAQKAPRADILERVEASLVSGLFWRTYDRDDALLLGARLYAETCRYKDALALVAKVKRNPCADRDYARILALYGEGRVPAAREAVSAALSLWPFDSRFARVFLSREAGNKADEASLKISATILSRLHLWENDDRSLLLLAVPFEPDPEARVRNIRVYRSMGKTDGAAGNMITEDSYSIPFLSALYALEYGVIDESAAVDELFAASAEGLDIAALDRLCPLVADKKLRASIAQRLSSYDGVIVADANGDGIVDSRVQYRLGRPVLALFDSDQDGYPDWTVSCDMGAPVTITGRSGKPVIAYDTYPSVRLVTDGVREYTITPGKLSWAPVAWVRDDLKLDGLDFYTIQLTRAEPVLTDRALLAASAFYVSPDPDRVGGTTKVSLENSVPISAVSTAGGQPYAWITYARGYPVSAREDRDGDGYFETVKTYAVKGRLESVLVDRNGNRKVEYAENYASDGTVTRQWDSDENGSFEITQSVSPGGVETTTWLHPDSGKPVVCIVENGSPRSVSYGGMNLAVLKDPVASVWWIGRMLAASRDSVKRIEDSFNHDATAVVSTTIQVEGKRIYAIRTGGILFAEILGE
jgi:hypothetical protein